MLNVAKWSCGAVQYAPLYDQHPSTLQEHEDLVICDLVCAQVLETIMGGVSVMLGLLFLKLSSWESSLFFFFYTTCELCQTALSVSAYEKGKEGEQASGSTSVLSTNW